MPTRKILFVDDDPNVLAGLQRTLRKQFDFDTALSGAEALELCKKHAYAVIVADMRMPGMDGLELLERVHAAAPDMVCVMLTGNADQQTAVEAVNRGQVFRFLNKPCGPEALVPALEASLQRYELRRVERELLEGTLMGSVKMMSEVLGMVAPNALGRGQRLRESMKQFAAFAGAAPVWELEVAALLSSIGYAALPAGMLAKLGSGDELTLPEEAILRRVPRIGHDLLVDIPRLGNVARIVLYQGKAFDGSGFPLDDCARDRLPPGARMLKILGDRAALENEGIVKQRALETMKARDGAYDPPLLEMCFACFPDFLGHAVVADRPVRMLKVLELAPDQVVVSDITTPEGLVLFGAGHLLTAMVLERLRNYDELGEVKQPVLVQDPPPPASVGQSSAAG